MSEPIQTTSKIGHFPVFALPPWFQGPEKFRAVLEELWGQCYPDLYQEGCAEPRALAEAENRALAALSDDDVLGHDDLGHRRMVWMALTLCSAVAVTVDAYLPGDSRPARVIALLEDWLHDPTARVNEDIRSLFSQAATPPQALHEALDVLYQATKTLERPNAVGALREMLDDCMEGYAIFPGSDGRRDLFNWWLVQALPASWCLRKPDVIYTMRLPWPPPDANVAAGLP
jgi:hypothetical protein